MWGRFLRDVKDFLHFSTSFGDSGRLGLELHGSLLSGLVDIHADELAHGHVALLLALDDGFALFNSKIVSTLVDSHPVKSFVVKAHKDLLVVLSHEVAAPLEHESLLLAQVVDILASLAVLRLLGGVRGRMLVFRVVR